MITLKIENMEAVTKAIEGKSKEAIKLITESNIQVANYMVGKVKDSISGRSDEPRSVDTGNMMRMVNGAGNVAGAVIQGNAEYTVFIEEGRHLKNGKFWEGRHHFRNTLEREKTKIKEFYVEKLKEL